jgi:signal transduction histidine kinase/ligand-binding sensor domain-containing protein
MAVTRRGIPTIFQRHACRLLLSLPSLFIAPLSPAQAAAPGPIPLHHASWTERDGAPGMVITMAQTSDGWLWLGGPNGLFRFDGVRFERYAEPSAPLPANGISILSAQASGDLWIGYRFGGASRLAGGKLRNYDERDGLPKSTAAWGFEADAGGRMWAATTRGMFYLDGERWRPAKDDWGLSAATYKTLMRDRHGMLWVQSDQGVYTLAPGAGRFTKLAVNSGMGVVTEVADGSVWSWDALHNRLNSLAPPDHGAAPRQWKLGGDELGAILFDRAGDLWGGRQEGVEYHTAQGMTRTGPGQGLSGGDITALFEDREGNIWAASATGIDRFRRQRVSKVAMPDNPGPQPLVADDAGGVWAGRFHVAARDGAAPLVTPIWPRSPVAWRNLVSYAYRDPGGVLWTGSFGGLWRKDGAKVGLVTSPAGIPDDIHFNALVRDQDGGLWTSVALHGLFRLGADGAWQRKDGRDGLPDEAPRALALAKDKRLWLAYPRNRVLRQTAAGWRTYGPADGVQLGMVMALHLGGGHVWAGGENGLALLRGERFIGVTGNDGRAFEGINSIVELNNGDLWLNGVSGLFRIPAADVAKLDSVDGHRVRYERLDGLDGLDGTGPVLLPAPSLALAADGRLWVTTTTGVFRFDPAARPAPRPAPPVLIRKIGPPGQARPALSGMRLAPGSGTLQIDYTATALALPERVRFRYRLDGVDAQWQDAGHRRAAYYNNLGAGDYQFRVQASNEDGAWPAEAAGTLDFSIAPTAVQTWWFKSLCALAALAVCWLAYRLRLRRLIAQVAVRMEERNNERERIARELHDTLLQSVQGLILHVHAAAVRLPEPEPVRAMIEKALSHADDVLHEGRDRVRDLRGADAAAGLSLAEALTEAGAHARPPDAAPPRLTVVGKPLRLHPAIQQETLAIAGEAIANAYRHAGAATIETHLLYCARELRLSIRDDGAGLPPEVLAKGGRDDHWGMSGMRERARRIKAKLTLHSEPGAGTEWLLVLPGSIAYQTKPRRLWAFNR